MRLNRITLRNYRGTIERTVTFGDRVTVVEGRNETGKSSLLDAFRHLRRFKASSKHQEIKSAQPSGRDIGPEVEAELTLGPNRVTIRKRWLKSPLTELSVAGPKPQALSGDAAHEAFLDLLSQTTDDQLLAALDIEQGQSLRQARLVELPALRSALDEAGTEIEGGDDLVIAVEQEYARWFTRGTGKPTGDYARLQKDLEELREQVANAEAAVTRAEELTERRKDVAQAAADVARSLAQAQEELAELRAINESLQALRQRVAEQEAAIEIARSAFAQAEESQRDRQLLLDEVHGMTEELSKVKMRFEAVREVAEVVEHESTAAGERRAELNKTVAERERQIDEKEQALRGAVAARKLDDLDERLAAITKADESLTAIRHEYQAVALDAGLLEQAEDAAGKLNLARALLEAGTASIRLQAQSEVVVDGVPIGIGEHAPIPISRETSIEVPGHLRLVITPNREAADLEREHQLAEARLADLLSRLGAADLEEARLRSRQAASLGEGLRDLEGQLAQLLRGDSREELTVERDRLAAAAGPGSIEALTQELADLRAAFSPLREDLERASRDVEASREAAAFQREASIRLETEARAAERRLGDATARLAAARERRGDDDVAADVEAARADVRAVEESLARARADLEASDAEVIALRLSNAEDLVTRHEREERELQGELRGIDALLEDQLQHGPYDQLADAKATLDAATAGYASMDRAAQAARLLRDVLLRHRDQAQLRYVAPFKERIERLGRIVFGQSFQVAITPDLSIESRTLDGVHVPFESLSAGAQEQLSLIGRLACAQLVDPGHGAPVIIDDALGFADPYRLRNLGTVLNAVGDSAQVIVLTCQPERFAHVGGAEVVRI